MERIKLDLVPGGCKPILHASQYDIGRQWWIELLNNGVPYVLQEDDVVEYEIRKGDGLVVTGSIAYIPGATYVILVSTEQMCAIYGSNLGELKISSNGAEIGTGNFILDVEKATTGGEKSKSVIWDLQAQVDDCTQKALENIGAKGLPFDNEDTDLEATNTEDAIKEVDEKVNEKADADSVYTKEEVNQLIDDLPEAMIFKGTLGVGGTITALPTASAENEGFTYKVITAGTYAGQSAKSGDVFVSNGSAWVLIPSGDEDNDTWRAIKVNGVEKLGNAISSGSVDFVDTDNVKFTFEANGNKVKATLSGIDTSEQVNEKVAGIIDDTEASESKVFSSNKVVDLLGDVYDYLDDISYTYVPVNYSELNATDVIIPEGKTATVTQEEDIISITNGSGVNFNLHFPLDDLPYETDKVIDFTIDSEDVVSNTSFYLTYGENHYISKTFTDNGDGTYSTSISMNSYDYSTFGKLYLTVNLRFNQTTPMKITLTGNEHGDVIKTRIKDDAIINLELNNLSDELQSLIINGSTYPTLYNGKEISVFNKGVAIGDSLTAGVFNTHDGYITNAAYSYPTKLKQISGVDMTNLGNGGKTSVQWYTDHENDDLSGYQFAIIQLGVNDAGVYHEWSQESETAFTNIINKLLNENNGIFVFVSTIIPAVSYSGEYYDAVSEGIRELVETLNNDHVILLDLAEYGNTGDKVGYNNGHLSALGYERLALDYISYISYVISQNLTLFRNVQFIGTNHVYP